MDSGNSTPRVPQNTGAPARIYHLKPFTKPDNSVGVNPGPGRSGAPAPPASALIHQKRNNGIDSVPTEEKRESESHLLPIISNPQALAVYVSKYVGKGFQHRRPADKGMRLVGCPSCQSRVAVLQIYLGDWQVHSDMAHSFVPCVNETLGLIGVIDSPALPLVGLGIETVIGIPTSAIN
jgi:hypothetical protein